VQHRAPPKAGLLLALRCSRTKTRFLPPGLQIDKPKDGKSRRDEKNKNDTVAK
jgi:hypothetical protein